MSYFEVEAKCGHVGRTNCMLIRFAVVAENGKDAAAKVRQFPRVKHDHKDAIRYVKKITFEAFMCLRAENDADPYLHCKSKWQQNLIDISDRIETDEYNMERKEKKWKKHDAEYRRLKSKIRIKSYNAMLKEYYYREAI